MWLKMAGFSPGACRSVALVAPASLGALARVLFLTIVVSSLVPHVEAVCPHCEGWITDCPGGDRCPMLTTLAKNQDVVVNGGSTTTPSLFRLLPTELLTVFTRGVTEAIMAIRRSPVAGTTPDFDSSEYSSHTSVVQAAIMGHVTVEEASLELQSRLEQASEATAVTKIKSALDILLKREGVAAPAQMVLPSQP